MTSEDSYTVMSSSDQSNHSQGGVLPINILASVAPTKRPSMLHLSSLRASSPTSRITFRPIEQIYYHIRVSICPSRVLISPEATPCSTVSSPLPDLDVYLQSCA